MAATVGFITIVRGLPIEIEGPSLDRLANETIAVARQHALSVYDASYLDLAMREGLPLATRDQLLRAASRAAGVELFE